MARKRVRKDTESRHEHWAKKSAIVTIISAVITFLGGLSLSTYAAGHVTPLAHEFLTAPFLISVVTLFFIAILVDYSRNSLNKVYWVEDVFGSIFGAGGYFMLFGLLGVISFATLSGLILSSMVMFAAFYLGFVIGHIFDRSLLKPAGVAIN